MEPAEVIDMIQTSRADKIALVIHNEQEILTGKSALKILNNFLQGTNKEIAIITPDKKIGKKLATGGFKVYSNLEDLERSEEIDFNGSSSKFKLSSFYLVGMIAIIFLAGIYFLYPTVTIEIQPVTETVSQEIVLKGSLETSTMNWENEVLPIHEFEVTLTDKEVITATGEKIVGVKKASGVVKFINENKEKVVIPEGTMVKTASGIKFKTLKDIEIPPLKVDYLMDVPVGMKAGQAEVKIESLVKGNRANVKTGVINKWEKPIKNVYVINPEPTIGGENKRTPIITKNDIDKMKIELEEKIKDKLISKIYKKLGGNYRILEDEIKYTEIDYNFNGKAGDKIDQIEGIGTIQASGYLLRNSEVDKMATHVINDSSKEEQYHLLTHGITVNGINLEKVKDGMYNIKLELNAQVIPKIETTNLAQKLTGKSLGKAVNILTSNQKIQEYKIHNKRDELPGLRYAIKIVVNQPDSYPVMSRNN